MYICIQYTASIAMYVRIYIYYNITFSYIHIRTYVCSSTKPGKTYISAPKN